MLPNLLVIGAMKAGTTSLHTYLAGHPQIFMSTPKELRFFSGETWDRGLSWYERHFESAGDALVVGESSPAYSQADIFPDAAARIIETLPGVRLVYLVREPLDRMRSMYVHLVASGRERRPAAIALSHDPIYMNSSRYRWQLDRYLPAVGADRVLVVTSEDLRSHPGATLAHVVAFAGADPTLSPTNLGPEQHLSDGKRRQTGASRRLASQGWYRAVSRKLPAPARRLTRRVTTRPIPESDVAIPSALAAELRERLVPEVAALRPFLPGSWDGWGIA